MSGLTEKQRQFVEAFQGEGRQDPKEAARLAGYKGTDSRLRSIGIENLSKPKIQSALLKESSAKAESRQRSSKRQNTNNLLRLASLSVAIIGLIIAAFSYMGIDHSNRLNLRSQADKKLDQAWTLLGERGGSVIAYESDVVRLGEALLKIQDAHTLDPEYSRVFYSYGAYYHAMKDFRQAQVCLREAIRLKQDSEVAFALLAAVLADKGDFEEAVTVLSTAISLQSGRDQVFLGRFYNQLGDLFVRQNILDAAHGAFMKAIDLSPLNYLAVRNLADVYFLRDEWEKCIDHASKAIELRPEDSTAYFYLGRCLSRMNQWEEATRALRKASDLSPNSASFLELGAILIHQKEWSRAELAFGEAIQLSSRSAQAHHGLGITFLNQGKYSKAIAEFQTVVNIRPKQAEAYFSLGKAFTLLGNHKKAAKVYQELSVVAPDDADVHNEWGGSLLTLGKAAEAADRYRTAIKLRTDHSVARHNLVNVLLDQGKIEEAIEVLKDGLGVEPNYRAFTQLGLALMGQGSIGEAESALRKAITIQPESPGAHMALATALLRKGDKVGAKNEYRRTIELEPNDTLPYIHLAILLLDEGDSLGATSVLSGAIELSPADPDLHYYLAIALQNQQEFELAENEIRSAIGYGLQEARAHFYLGVLLAKKNSLDEAEGELRKAIAISPAPDYFEVLSEVLFEGGKYLEAREVARKGQELRDQRKN